jgi:hypothetical protein
MMLRDAAERVLREIGRPMHSAEIIKHAIKRGWVTPKGKTPDHSLQASIWKDIQRNGSRSRFKMVGQGRNQLRYWLRQSA